MTNNDQLKKDTQALYDAIRHYQSKYGYTLFGKRVTSDFQAVEALLDSFLTILNTDKENEEKERIKSYC